MNKFIFLVICCVFITINYTCQDIKDNNDNIDFFNVAYVILDKSSNSYSNEGGVEENFINIDTAYIRNLIIDLYYNKNRNHNKISIILLFNYVDINSEGNKEIYIEIPIISAIDTIYKPEPGQIVSVKNKFDKNVKSQKEVIIEQDIVFKSKLNSILIEIEELLIKSKKTRGSDCSGTLKTADKRLDALLFGKNKQVKNKIIIAFSDLVNYPLNKEKISLNNIIIRPGYTSDVPYIDKKGIINLTTNEEFENYLRDLFTNF